MYLVHHAWLNNHRPFIKHSLATFLATIIKPKKWGNFISILPQGRSRVHFTWCDWQYWLHALPSCHLLVTQRMSCCSVQSRLCSVTGGRHFLNGMLLTECGADLTEFGKLRLYSCVPHLLDCFADIWWYVQADLRMATDLPFSMKIPFSVHPTLMYFSRDVRYKKAMYSLFQASLLLFYSSVCIIMLCGWCA